ncbi:hypothetical protein ACH5RR_006722 [Cinchona calisaya]|uniref:RNase H type-1 domain-containing protein n=1 Tax=Cinchona calisaya TaxID=153742 RepID=A0ABD3APV4_9GENT
MKNLPQGGEWKVVHLHWKSGWGVVLSVCFLLWQGDQVESCGLLDGLKMCIRMNILNVDVENDSEALLKIVTSIIRPPWRMDSVIHEIVCLLAQGDFTLHHVFSKANFVVDFLA